MTNAIRILFFMCLFGSAYTVHAIDLAGGEDIGEGLKALGKGLEELAEQLPTTASNIDPLGLNRITIQIAKLQQTILEERAKNQELVKLIDDEHREFLFGGATWRHYDRKMNQRNKATLETLLNTARVSPSGIRGFTTSAGDLHLYIRQGDDSSVHYQILELDWPNTDQVSANLSRGEYLVLGLTANNNHLWYVAIDRSKLLEWE